MLHGRKQPFSKHKNVYKDIYKDIINDIEKGFDTSDYVVKRPLPKVSDIICRT